MNPSIQAPRATGYRREYFAGLDLGQKRDYTALALIEQTEIAYDRRDPVTWEPLRETQRRLVHAERLPLGTTYPAIVEHVRDLLMRAPVWEVPTLVVDATGVGAPVVDLLRARRLPGKLVPVVITAGDKAHSENNTWKVPRRDLIAGLQIAFETQSLRIESSVTAVETLITELMSMRCTVTASGHERIDTWREGAHDDLVFAVALAWWEMSRQKPPRR